jgi:hypothetical protein
MRLGWLPMREYGRVEVGVVTGDNDFFLLPAGTAQQLCADILTPVVCSARDLRGIEFGARDFQQIVGQGRPVFLLNMRESAAKLGPNERAYLALGERRRVPDKYKCRIRDPWYAVPSVWPPDAIMLRQAGDMPRVVHLSKRCTATDTVHRVTWRRPSQGRRLTVAFMNTLTLLAAELTGRSYGGGVLELMPKEANQLPMPEPVAVLEPLFDQVDAMVRNKEHWGAVDLCDRVVFPAWVSKKEKASLRCSLLSLVERRKHRTAKSA